MMMMYITNPDPKGKSMASVNICRTVLVEYTYLYNWKYA